MSGAENSDDSLNEILSYILENKRYLILLVFYLLSYPLLLFLILNSFQEILNSKLIEFIITMYYKDKLITVTSLIGLVGALTLLIGYISSENGEKAISREGKLLSGIVFWHNHIFKITFSSIILIIVFAYLKNYQELFILIILIIISFLMWSHFTAYLTNAYNWDSLENNEYKIDLNGNFVALAFNVGFFFYIYSLQYVETVIFNLLNIWILFICTIILASVKYPRTERIIVKYSDNKEEYAHLVRIENGFARLITKESASKKINLTEIKEINYDINYIENFRKNISSVDD